MSDLEMAVVCRRCGREHVPDHAAYVRGTWRTCRRCRDGPGDPEDAPEGYSFVDDTDRPPAADMKGQHR